MVAAFLAAGTTLLLAQRPPRDQAALRRGQLALRAGDTAAAVRHLEGALALNPRNLQAHESLVRALLARKRFDDAEAALQAAGQAGLSDAALLLWTSRVRRARATHRLDSAGRALSPELCDAVLAEDFDPALRAVEDHAQRTGRTAEVEELLGSLYAEKTRILYAKQRCLAHDLFRASETGQTDRASRLRAALLAMSPDLRAAQQNYVTAYMRAIQLAPQAETPRLAFAEYALAGFFPRPEQAKAALAPLLQRPNPPLEAVRLQALAERHAEEFEPALARIRILRQQKPRDLILMQTELDLLDKLERWGEIEELTASLLESSPNDAIARYFRARAMFRTDRMEDALNSIQPIFQNKDLLWPQARLLLAEAQLRQGNREQAIRTFQEVIQDSRKPAIRNAELEMEVREARYRAHIVLAREYAAASSLFAADHVRKAALLFPEREEVVRLALQVMTGAQREEVSELLALHVSTVGQKNGSAKALDVCRAALESLPGDERLRSVQAGLLARAGRHEQAVSVLKALAEDFPNRPGYQRDLASLYLVLGRDDDACAIFARLYEADPQDVPSLAALLGSLLRHNRTDAALAALKVGDPTSDQGLALGRTVGVYLEKQTLAVATELAASQVRTTPDDPQALCLLAELQWRRGNRDAAQAAMDEALRLDPTYLPAWRRGLLDLEAGRTAEAVGRFRELCRRSPTYLGGKMALALALTMDGQGEEAEKAIREMRSLANPNHAQAAGLRWLIAALPAPSAQDDAAESRTEDTIARIQRVVREYPDLLMARLVLSDLQERTGRLSDAILTLEEALAAAPPDQAPRILLRLAALQEKNEDLAAAASTYRAAAEHPAAEAQASNNLAWLLAVRMGKAEEALPFAQRAAALLPRQGEVLDTAAWVCHLAGRREDAQRYAEMAVLAAPELAEAHYHLGMVMLREGRKDRAREALARALRLSSDFHGRNEAEAALRGIGNGDR